MRYRHLRLEYIGFEHMKKFLLIASGIAATSTLYSQMNCDSLCATYAAPGTYQILNNPDEAGSEVIGLSGYNQAELNCEILCEIETKRQDHDVTIQYKGLVILIYASQDIQLEPVENE